MDIKFGRSFSTAIFLLSFSVYAQAQTIQGKQSDNSSLGSEWRIVQTNNLQTWPTRQHYHINHLNLAQVNSGQNGVDDNYVEDLNSNTATIISGTPSGTWMYMAHDMSAVLDNNTNLRILPIMGKGSAQNIRDILYLKGIDMGIVQSNILQYFEKTGEAGKNINNKLRYITRLHNQEIHLLVRPEIKTIKDLVGKRVNFANKGSGSQITAKLLFEKYNIDVQEVNMQINDSFEKMKSGELAGTFFSAGKPLRAFRRLSDETGFKFLELPYEKAVANNFYPATFTHEDYPNIIPEGKVVSTLSESAVLVSFNWGANTDRYKRVAKFTKAFFENFDKFLKKPRHSKWKEVNLAADLPGWTRFVPAQEMLDKVSVTDSWAANNQDGQKSLQGNFSRFLSNLPQAEANAAVFSKRRRDELFRKFLEWQDEQ